MWSSLFLFLKKGDLQDEATGEKEYTMETKIEIGICTILELNTNCHQCCSVARSLLVS